MKMLIFVLFFQILINILNVQSLNTDYVGYGLRDDTNRNYGHYPEISGYSKSFRRSRTSKDFNFMPNHNNNDDNEQETENDASNYLRNFKPFLDDSDTDKLTEQQKLLLKNIADRLAQHEPEIVQEHQRKTLNLNNENANEGRARTKKNNSSKRKAKRPAIVVAQDSTTPSITTKVTTKTSIATSQGPATKTTVNQLGNSSTMKATTKSAVKSTATRQNAKIVAKNSISTTNKPNTSRLPPSDIKRNITSEDVGRGDSLSKLKPDQQPAESKVRIDR